MATPAPRARLRDHLRVAWLLVRSAGGGLLYVLYIPLAAFIAPVHRAIFRRRLATMQVSEPAPVTWPELPDDAPYRVFVAVGEASGDRLAATAIRALRARYPHVEVRGFGGPACAEAGMQVDRDLLAHAVVGWIAVVKSLGFWWGVCVEALARWREARPDLVLTVDFPGLNVRLAEWARRDGMRTVHLVAPQVWAHGPWRVFRWRRAVHRMLALMPFDDALLGAGTMKTTYVGHPLFEAPLDPARTPADPPVAPPRIELWPGSRAREIARNAPVLLEAAAALEARLPRGPTFLVRLADAADQARFERASLDASARPTTLAFHVGARHPDPHLLGALCTSGTATAQLAVDQVPLVSFYVVGPITWVGSKLLSAPFICLANLVAGRGLVPEFLLVRRTAAPQTLASALLPQVATETARRESREALAIVRERMAREDVASRIAACVGEELRAARP